MRNMFIKTALFVLAGIGLLVGDALATPVDVDIAGVSDGSFATLALNRVIGSTHLEVNLAAGLDDVSFTLDDGETSDWFDFLTFTVTGTGFGSFGIVTTMAFDTPGIDSVTGNGAGIWGSVDLGSLGFYSGGALWWGDNTYDTIDGIGNSITVTLSQGIVSGNGTSVNLKAQITNNGGGTAPVPEPATMLLFGAGLAGLAGVARRKKR